MDWTQLTQVLTISGPIVASIGAAGFALYKMAKSEFTGIKSSFAEFKESLTKIDTQHREDNALMNANHREDMKSHQADIIRMDEKWERTLNKMDEKWERLFENYLSK